jgi:hypothetical protein
MIRGDGGRCGDIVPLSTLFVRRKKVKNMHHRGSEGSEKKVVHDRSKSTAVRLKLQ